MKKKLLISIMLLFAIISNLVVANAATGTAELKASNTSVKPGDTFTVTLYAICEEGINGVVTKYSYDSDKLDLIEHKAGSKFSDLNGDSTSDIQVMISSGSATTADIYVLTFKVKDSVTSGTTTIKTDAIKLDSDASENSTVNIEPVSTTVTITSNGTQTTSTLSNSETSSQSGTSNSSSVSGKSDATTSEKTLPSTGLAYGGLGILVVVVIIAIYSYRKMNKCKNDD